MKLGNTKDSLGKETIKVDERTKIFMWMANSFYYGYRTSIHHGVEEKGTECGGGGGNVSEKKQYNETTLL